MVWLPDLFSRTFCILIHVQGSLLRLRRCPIPYVMARVVSLHSIHQARPKNESAPPTRKDGKP